MQTVSLSFFRFSTTFSQLWAIYMMGAARPQLRRVSGIEFWKLCGSGSGEGFNPVPNLAIYAILATWQTEDIARKHIHAHKLWQRYRAQAVEDWTVFLAATSTRGCWSSRSPFTVTESSAHGPIAVLTRATIKPRIAAKFWAQVPDISNVIKRDSEVLFKIGLGEVPLLHQVTFSIWPNAGAMTQFARQPEGPHQRAINAVRSGNWFREELYARFTVTGDLGSWGGRSPLHMQAHQK